VLALALSWEQRMPLIFRVSDSWPCFGRELGILHGKICKLWQENKETSKKWSTLKVLRDAKEGFLLLPTPRV